MKWYDIVHLVLVFLQSGSNIPEALLYQIIQDLLPLTMQAW